MSKKIELGLLAKSIKAILGQDKSKLTSWPCEWIVFDNQKYIMYNRVVKDDS